MTDLDFQLKSLEVEDEDIIIEDEDLFNESILESQKNRYKEHYDALGIIEDKDQDSFYDLYSEWPVPEGNWIIIKLMVVIILLLIVKIKPMFWSWLMI